MIRLRFFLSRLLHAKKFLNLSQISTVYQSCMYKVSFLLFSLLSQDVTVKSVLSLDFTCSGKSESFLEPELVFTFGILLNFNYYYSMAATHYTGALHALFYFHSASSAFGATGLAVFLGAVAFLGDKEIVILLPSNNGICSTFA